MFHVTSQAWTAPRNWHRLRGIEWSAILCSIFIEVLGKKFRQHFRRFNDNSGAFCFVPIWLYNRRNSLCSYNLEKKAFWWLLPRQNYLSRSFQVLISLKATQRSWIMLHRLTMVLIHVQSFWGVFKLKNQIITILTQQMKDPLYVHSVLKCGVKDPHRGSFQWAFSAEGSSPRNAFYFYFYYYFFTTSSNTDNANWSTCLFRVAQYEMY